MNSELGKGDVLSKILKASLEGARMSEILTKLDSPKEKEVAHKAIDYMLEAKLLSVDESTQIYKTTRFGRNWLSTQETAAKWVTRKFGSNAMTP